MLYILLSMEVKTESSTVESVNNIANTLDSKLNITEELIYSNLTSKDLDNIFDVKILGEIIAEHRYNIKQRISCLFQLRSLGTYEAVLALENALLKEPYSDLLRHEICYVFGQMIDKENNVKEIERFLNTEIFDKPEKWASIVLHEAAEALGNINNGNNLELLKRFADYKDEIIKETCELAIANVEWLNKTYKGKTEGLDPESDCRMYNSNDPAPPFNYHVDKNYLDIDYLRKVLFEDDLFNKYRVLFTLRNLATEEAVGLMCECFTDKFTPLFKHEVAFVLGQMAKTASKALSKLEEVLQDENENAIVRHETALALGEIAKGKDLLEKYSTHKDQLVAESCIIATEFVDFWNECC